MRQLATPPESEFSRRGKQFGANLFLGGSSGGLTIQLEVNRKAV
jgi:hypothetical protein